LEWLELPQEMRVRLHLLAEQEFYTQNILEAYDGLILITSCCRQGDSVEMQLTSSAPFASILREVLDDLAREVGLFYQEEPVA
jgi:hypothetical protein